MSHSLRRILRFVTVGSTCFTLQYLTGLSLAWAQIPWPVANATGFLLSAQVNFVLSATWTWQDRATWSGPKRIGRAGRRWLSYNATALLALGVNTGVFTLTYQVLGPLPAAMLGVLAGTAATYLVCDLVIFRRVGAVLPARAGSVSPSVSPGDSGRVAAGVPEVA